MKKTLGGDRLGSGNKIKVELRNFERSTHDLGYLWRSTISAGTLVPFLSEIALPGDTFDINLNCDVKTHPTVGPLFGSYKVQLDVFQAPIRLYNALLHNNALNIGLDMAKVKFPIIEMTALETETTNTDINNSQVNPSSLLAYLGIRGIGYVPTGDGTQTRTFNALPILAYWDIYKNYYSNKQEEIGAVIHSPVDVIINTVDSITISGVTVPSSGTGVVPIGINSPIIIQYTGTTPLPSQIILNTSFGDITAAAIVSSGGYVNDTVGTKLDGTANNAFNGVTVYSWRYRDSNDINAGQPQVVTFDLSEIDDMRNYILATQSTTTPLNISTPALEPYKWLAELNTEGIPNILSSQEGLGLKTYQSDILNNWLQTEWIDGVGGINDITSIDTSGGSFEINTLILARKVYDMLNQIAISGGTYDDWIDAVYMNERYRHCETPMYMGGLIKELTFQEVVSNSQTADQPLGTLAGKGTMSHKHKGGNITIKVDEPSYIIGIISLTPRIDYSQGNKWDMSLETMNDLHKPHLDEIGFQELITEQMAWWDTHWNNTTSLWEQQSAGKQPAWINYMTNINKVYGNFAIASNEMFMTLNRRYEQNDTTKHIKDLTTYIDPSKYNFIFAETSIDAQNFWTQIAVDMTTRRKMSAKVMPNL